jgi:hypothetical protein
MYSQKIDSERGLRNSPIAHTVTQGQDRQSEQASFVDRRPEAVQVRQLQRLADAYAQKQFSFLPSSLNPAPVQLVKTALPNVDSDEMEFEELDLVLDTKSVFSTGLSNKAADAYYDYLKNTKEDDLPAILRQVKGVLKELEDGTRTVPDSWSHVPIAQIAAVISHSLQGYLANADLRSEKLDATKHKNLLENYPQLGNTVLGLDRMPPYTGWVYRGQSVPPDLAGTYKKGATIVFKGFTSTTKSARVSNQFKPSKEEEVGMMLTLYSVTGRDISEIAHDPAEQEVLFAPGTAFHILGVEQTAKLLEVTMVETSAGNLNAAPPDRLKEAEKEKPPAKKQVVEESSGPSMIEMLMALDSAKVPMPKDITAEGVEKLYHEHFPKK